MSTRIRQWVLLVCLAASATVALAAEFSFREVKTRLVDGNYRLDAQIDYRLSTDANEALVNGVPLTFVIRIEVRRRGAWIWESDLLEARLRYTLRYHPLDEAYEVTDHATQSVSRYATLRSALVALGELRDFNLISASRFEQGEKYEVRIYTELDIESLPLPLRPVAYVTPEWNLESETRVWLLNR